MAKVAAVVVAGGTAQRFGARSGKQLLELAGRPVVAWSVDALSQAPEVGLVVVVCPAEQRPAFEAALSSAGVPEPVRFAPSGASRQQSVVSGLAAVPPEYDIVAIHDGARPLLRPQSVTRALSALLADDTLDGVVLGHPSVDTVKIVDDDCVVVSTPDRAHTWAVQTPQIFRRGALERAHTAALERGREHTDDAGVVEAAGGRVMLVEGERDNLKVTVPADAELAGALLAARRGEGAR